MEKSLAVSQSVFVLELVSAGYFGDRIEPNFRAEGRAMLDAVLEDFRRISDVSTSTVFDKAADGIRGLLLRDVENISADAALIIAPEFDHLLEEFCHASRSSGARSLNCDERALTLCDDKWRFHYHLVEFGVPTIDTELFDLPAAPPTFPCVVKPRDGAGSWLVRMISRGEDWPNIMEVYTSASRTELLCQPLIRGRSYSVAAIVSPGRTPELLPIAEQRLSNDGEFHYLGGEIPAPISDATATRINRLVERCFANIPGLHGYIGCDVIVPDDDPEQPLIVEVNPRLTTSYIGYRQLCKENLMERILFPDRFPRPLRWREGAVSFDPDGDCRYADFKSRIGL